MQRLSGHYSIRSKAIAQQDYQIVPHHWTTVEGYKLPIRGPFTQVTCDRGIALLYVSEPGEVPLYYSTTPGYIHWHEQRLALPGKGVTRVNQGEAVLWTPQGVRTFFQVDQLPRPSIREAVPIDEAIAEYQQHIVTAVRARLSVSRVAVAQSGGIDSLLVTWALRQLGAEVVPMTVCTTPEDLDIQAARAATQAMGLKCLPIVVNDADIEPLLLESLAAIEQTETSNVRMAIGNILMARKCRELGIEMIFSGHGHDDVMGKGTLVKGVLAQQVGTPSERWRDTRWLGTAATSGMLKMFSTTFRRYGVQVRMPYYDADLLEWAFSQPVEVLPIEFKKQFARKVAAATLPPGFWLEEKHSVGYLTGAGLSLKQALLNSKKDLFAGTSLSQRLKWLRERKKHARKNSNATQQNKISTP